MKESTDSIVMSDDQRRMLDQVYNVRRKQQAYFNGEIGMELCEVAKSW